MLDDAIVAHRPLGYVTVHIDHVGVWVQLLQLENKLISWGIGDRHKASRHVGQLFHQPRLVMPAPVHIDPFLHVF